MSGTVRKVLETLFPGDCYEKVVNRFDLFNVGCIKYAISKSLGYGIIVGSTLVKVPQILKIIKARSAEGINLSAVLMELAGITATAAYSFSNNYPFSSWGESLFLMLETAFIASLVLHYTKRTQKAFLFFASYVALLAIIASKVTPIKVLWFLQASSVPVIISGKLIQAWANFQNGHTGQLSAVTITLLFLGAMARIFTSVTETGDTLIIVTYIFATFANFFLFAQVLYYWDETKRRLEKEKSL